MKYQVAESCIRDYKRLNQEERSLFCEAVRQLNDAFSHRGDRALRHWPSALRIKSVRGASGIGEMTWSFSDPDGWATFELTTVEGEPAIRRRRIGTHQILREP